MGQTPNESSYSLETVYDNGLLFFLKDSKSLIVDL